MDEKSNSAKRRRLVFKTSSGARSGCANNIRMGTKRVHSTRNEFIHRDPSLSRRTVLSRESKIMVAVCSASVPLAKAGWLDLYAFIEILRIANAIGNVQLRRAAP